MLREQRRLLETQIELAQLKRSEKLLESLALWDGFDGFGGSDLWDRLRPRDQSDGGRWIPMALASDRRHGASWPLWRNETERAKLQQLSRVLCCPQGNAYAWGMLQNLVNYTVGDGCTYEVSTTDSLPDADQSQPGRQVPGWLEKQVSIAQDVLDEFLRLNRWNLQQHDHTSTNPLAGSREHETVRRVFRDGESFWRLFRQEDGRTYVRFVEPEQVIDPPGASPQDGWSYGILHQIYPFEDVETVEQYHIRYSDATTPNHSANQPKDAMGELVSADQIIHLKGPHTDSTVKRGTPYFAGDTAEAFQRASKLQRTLSITDTVRAASAELWKHPTATSAGLASMASNLATRTRTNAETGKTEQVERIGPGAVRRMDGGWEPVPPFSSDSQGFLATAQGDLRQGATAFCAPEYLASGDASNANFASTKEAGTPFVRFGSGNQGYFTGAFCRVAYAALAWAAECGRLDKQALPMLMLNVVAPDIAMRSELERAQEDQILVPAKIKSRKTAQQERGLDPDQEDAAILGDEEKFGPMEQQLPMPDENGRMPPTKKPALPRLPKPGSQVRESKDASGHEHASDGRFGTVAGQHGGGGDGKKNDKEKNHWEMTAGEALKNGIDYHKWKNAVVDAFRDEKTAEDDPIYHKVNTINRDDYQRAQRLLGKQVEARGEIVTLTDVAPDLSHVTVTHADGKTSRHAMADLVSLDGLIGYAVDDAKDNSLHPSRAAQIAPYLAQEIIDKNGNLFSFLKEKGINPTSRGGRILRDAVAKSIEDIRAEQSKPSDMRQRAMDKARENTSGSVHESADASDPGGNHIITEADLLPE